MHNYGQFTILVTTGYGSLSHNVSQIWFWIFLIFVQIVQKSKLYKIKIMQKIKIVQIIKMWHFDYLYNFDFCIILILYNFDLGLFWFLDNLVFLIIVMLDKFDIGYFFLFLYKRAAHILIICTILIFYIILILYNFWFRTILIFEQFGLLIIVRVYLKIKNIQNQICPTIIKKPNCPKI